MDKVWYNATPLILWNHMEQLERESIKELLKTSKLHIEFTKVDGTDSTITATLNPALLPPLPPVVESAEPKPAKTPRKVNEDLLYFYSPDREGWRNVKYDLIKSYKVV